MPGRATVGWQGNSNSSATGMMTMGAADACAMTDPPGIAEQTAKPLRGARDSGPLAGCRPFLAEPTDEDT
eukprot:11191796-Lingulodinium_polyedra.AAC.1